MTDKNKNSLKHRRVVIRNGVFSLRLFLGFALAFAWPMVPSETAHLNYGWRRLFHRDRWIIARDGFVEVAWQIRVLWLMFGRIVTVESASKVMNKIQDMYEDEPTP